MGYWILHSTGISKADPNSVFVMGGERGKQHNKAHVALPVEPGTGQQINGSWSGI